MKRDLIIANGSGLMGSGSVATRLLKTGMNPNIARPYLRNDPRIKGDEARHVAHPSDARSYITNNGKRYVTNANATLLRLEWTLLDEIVVKAAQSRLRAVSDIRGRGLQFTIPNGMAKTVLSTQTQSDFGPATISMSGLAKSMGDRPVYGLGNLPLPIIHKDFQFDAREIATAREGNAPLDLSAAELAARRVAEGVEQLTLGVSPTYSYGQGAIYGMTNFPQRLTMNLASPLASSWIPRYLVNNVLGMRTMAQQHHHYGPYILYTSLAWDAYLDNDLNALDANSSNITLRDRLRRIEGIDDVVTLDYLNGYDAVLVQMTTDVTRMVVGMDITTLQWETEGGMQLNFKVMCIIVPQFRADFKGNTGIVHGTVPGQTFQPADAVYISNSNP